MNSNVNKLKIGFLLDSKKCANNVFELIEMTISEKAIFDPIILIDNTESNKAKLKTKSLVSKEKKSLTKSILYRIINKLETIILNKTNLSGSDRILNIDLLNLNKFFINCNISSSHLYKDFDQNISNIKELKLDIIIRCGSGILKGKILNVTQYGILSSHHGDNRYYRGGPGGFWEVYNNSPESGFVIQKLNERLDGGDVISRNNYTTEKLWILNNKNLQKECNKSWMKLLNYIHKNKSLPEKEMEIGRIVKINKFPENKVLFNYFVRKTLYHFLIFFLSKKN